MKAYIRAELTVLRVSAQDLISTSVTGKDPGKDDQDWDLSSLNL